MTILFPQNDKRPYLRGGSDLWDSEAGQLLLDDYFAEELIPGDRYWIGDSGDWDDTAHWSLTSGGAGGAPVPTYVNNAIFDASSLSDNGFTVTIPTGTQVLELNTTLITYGLIFTGDLEILTSAYLTNSPGIDMTGLNLVFNSASITPTLTSVVLGNVTFKTGSVVTLETSEYNQPAAGTTIIETGATVYINGSSFFGRLIADAGSTIDFTTAGGNDLGITGSTFDVAGATIIAADGISLDYAGTLSGGDTFHTVKFGGQTFANFNAPSLLDTESLYVYGSATFLNSFSAAPSSGDINVYFEGGETISTLQVAVGGTTSATVVTNHGTGNAIWLDINTVYQEYSLTAGTYSNITANGFALYNGYFDVGAVDGGSTLNQFMWYATGETPYTLTLSGDYDAIPEGEYQTFKYAEYATYTPKFHTYQDNLNGDGSNFVGNGNQGTATFNGSTLQLIPDELTADNAARVQTMGLYDLQSSEFVVNLKNYIRGNTQNVYTEILIKSAYNSANRVGFVVQSGPGGDKLIANLSIGGDITNGSPNTPISLVTHAWLKIKELSGTFYLDYSSDGVSWTNFYSYSSTGFALGANLVDFRAWTGVESGQNTAALQYAEFDSINLAPATIDVTKSAQYAVQTIPADITKSSQYSVAIDVDVTKSASYVVTFNTDVQKTAQYVVISSQDLAKTATYTVTTNIDVSKSAQYTVDTILDVTKSADYSVTTTLDVTKSATYVPTFTVDVTQSASYVVLSNQDVAKTAQYTVPFDYTVSNSGQYTVVTTLDVTKSASYSVATSTDATKSASYNVAFDIDITKSAAYTVVTSQDITKTGQYTVPNTVTVGVSGQYAVPTTGDTTTSAEYSVATSTDITKSATYTVLTNTDVTLGAIYAVVIGGDIPLAGQYIVSSEVTTQKSAQYAVPSTPGDTTVVAEYLVAAESDSTKQAQYTVVSAVDVSKVAAYSVATILTATVNASYSVTFETDTTKQASYLVATTTDTTKSADYDVIFNTDVTKQAVYAVAFVASDITKTATYAVASSVDVTKQATYVVPVSQDVTKQSSYAVSSTVTVAINAAYAVVSSTDVSKVAQYAVASTQTVSNTAQYVVESATVDLTKPSQYTVATEFTVSSTASYVITSDYTTTKVATYTVSFGTDLQKIAQYTITGDETITLPSRYDVTLFGLTKKRVILLGTWTIKPIKVLENGVWVPKPIKIRGG